MRQGAFWSCCLIIFIGGLVYANSIHNSFLFDDSVFIIHNPFIHAPFNFVDINNSYPHRFLGTWTFALNYALGGLHVEGYHAVNILIHILCGLFVWWLFVQILSSPLFSNSVIAQEKEMLATWVALLFITHPVQTTAVDQITQRYVLLAAMFYLMSLSFYLKARLVRDGRSWYFFAASVLAAGMGIFCRETFVTLPLAIILCEILFLNNAQRLFNAKSWLIFLVVPVLILSFYHFDFSHVLNAQYPSQSHQGETINALNYFLTQSRVILVYLRLLFWPVDLNFDYDIRLSHSFGDPVVIAGFFVIAVILYIAWAFRSKYPLLSFAIGWFFLTLSVESTIIPIAYVIAEYRLYLPLFGFCIAAVYALRLLVKDLKLFTLLMGLIILVFAVLSIQRNTVYKDEMTLWTDTVQKSPYKSRPYAYLGSAYMNDKEYARALVYYNKALVLDATNQEALINLTTLYIMMGDLDKAMVLDQKLLRIQPSATEYNDLGVIYRIKGDWPHALKYFILARESPNAYRYLFQIDLNIAEVYWSMGQKKQAIRTYLTLPMTLSL